MLQLAIQVNEIRKICKLNYIKSNKEANVQGFMIIKFQNKNRKFFKNPKNFFKTMELLNKKKFKTKKVKPAI